MPKDYTARAWFEKAAAAGFAASMTQVGSICTNAPGIAADPVQARHWYEKASSAGDLFGMQYAAMHWIRAKADPPIQCRRPISCCALQNWGTRGP